MSSKRASDNEELGTAGKKLKRTIEDASDEFLCPITLKLPFHPVIAEDGRIYEREAIEQWFKSQANHGGVKSPVTNVAMGASLVEAKQVKNLIELLVNSGAVQPDKASDWTQLLSEKETFKKWRELAEGGDSDAMILVGEAYRTASNGVRACHLTSAKWFMRAGRSGNAKGYEKLRLSQIEYCPRPYMHAQTVVTCEMREILIDWLVEVHFLLGFKPETLHLAVGLVDRFGLSESMVREKLQLVGVASLLVACKAKCEPSPPDCHYLAHLTANAYSSFEVEAMQEFLVRKFGASISVPTSFDFLVELLSHQDLKPANHTSTSDTSTSVSTSTSDQNHESISEVEKVKLRAWYYLEQSILNHDMLKYTPSLIASAAFLLANCAKYIVQFQPTSNPSEEKKTGGEGKKGDTKRRRSERVKRASVISTISTSTSTSTMTSTDVEIYENLQHIEMLQQLQHNIKAGRGNAEVGIRRRKLIGGIKVTSKHDMFSLVEYGCMKHDQGVEAFGHDSSSVIECAIVMSKEVCRPPRRTPQGRVLDSVLKKYSDAAMHVIAKEPLHPCIQAASRRSSNLPSFTNEDRSWASFTSTSSQVSTLPVVSPISSNTRASRSASPITRLSQHRNQRAENTMVPVRS